MIKRNILDCMTLVGGAPSRYEGEKTYVSTGAVDCDHVDYAQAERVTYDNRPSRANLSVAEGDILFAKMCGTKKTLRIDRPLSEHLYSTGFCAVRANESIMDAALLYHLLASDQFLTQKDQNSSGATQKAITNAGLRKIVIQVPDLSEQRKLAANLDCIEQLMAKRREQLVSFDQLVKSRFIELFGDPVRNSMGLPTEPMTTVCAIIDGDRGKNYPKQDEFSDAGYCLFLNAKNVTATGFSFENRMFITKEKDNALHNGKLERGDVVLTTRGTLGNLAFYDDSVPFENVRINSGMVILRMKKSVMTEVFFMEQFKLQLQSIKGKIASGSAQPQLPISTMSKIRILLAPMALQEQFAAFVEQTDKSKLCGMMEVAA